MPVALAGVRRTPMVEPRYCSTCGQFHGPLTTAGCPNTAVGRVEFAPAATTFVVNGVGRTVLSAAEFWRAGLSVLLNLSATGGSAGPVLDEDQDRPAGAGGRDRGAEPARPRLRPARSRVGGADAGGRPRGPSDRAPRDVGGDHPPANPRLHRRRGPGDPALAVLYFARNADTHSPTSSGPR